MSIRQQYIYCNSHAFGVLIDQIKNWILEAYHQQLGEDLTFIIWWLSFYFENIGIYVDIYNKLQGHIDQYKAGGRVGEVKLSSKFSFQFLSILHTKPGFDFDLELELDSILTLYFFQHYGWCLTLEFICGQSLGFQSLMGGRAASIPGPPSPEDKSSQQGRMCLKPKRSWI